MCRRTCQLELVGFVRKAEELGFPEVWVAEDCFLHGAFSQAATVLASTASLRVGMGIIPVAARNVAFAAMEIATLAELHPGRLAVGVGHSMPGWLREAGEPCGPHPGHPGAARPRLACAAARIAQAGHMFGLNAANSPAGSGRRPH